MIGSQFDLIDDDRSVAVSVVILAQNREGYGNLCELITLARTRAEKGTYRLTPADVAVPEGNYAHLRGMPHGVVA